MIELKQENGSLNVWCSHCGVLLEKSTKELRELAGVESMTEFKVVCDKCEAKTNFTIQLGNKEYGKL